MKHVAELKSRIESAFEPVPYPGDENIVYGGYSPEGDELGDIKKHFARKDWRAGPRDRIFKSHILGCGLLQMTPEAFHYFLPRFIVAIIDYGPEKSWDLTGSVVDSLIQRSRRDLKVGRLSIEQKMAVAEFVKSLHEAYPDDTERAEEIIQRLEVPNA